jgi:hypothetical protein
MAAWNFTSFGATNGRNITRSQSRKIELMRDLLELVVVTVSVPTGSVGTKRVIQKIEK